MRRRTFRNVPQEEGDRIVGADGSGPLVRRCRRMRHDELREAAELEAGEQRFHLALESMLDSFTIVSPDRAILLRCPIATFWEESLSRVASTPSPVSIGTGAAAPAPRTAGATQSAWWSRLAFLEHQRRIGNDLITAMPQYRFPGLEAGDRWCVTAMNWLRAHADGAAAYVVLASTHERALEFVPLAALREHAVDVPSDPGPLTD